MKKLFLIPLMALMSCVMAFATVRTAGTLAELQSALADAEDGDEIQLTADINYSTGSTVACSVSKNVTIDGQGHTISGSGKCVFLVQGTSAKHVTAAVFKNLKLNNSTGRVFQLYDYLDRVDIDNCELSSQGASSIGGSNPEVITPWSDTGQFELNLTNTRILATASGYPIITHCPLKINANNSYFAGYCGLYFKSGSAGSIVNADACNFDAPNIHSGQSNSFAVFPMEDTPLTFNLNNCGMNAEQLGDQGQPVFTLSEYTKDADRTGQVNITISGDNTYINCNTEWLWNSFWWNNPSGKPQYGSNSAPTITTAEAAVHVNVNAQVTGGTYSADPREMIYWNDQYKDGEGYHYNLGHITIPDGYEVKAVTTQQGDQTTTLYRVRHEITGSTALNDNNGQNEDKQIKVTENVTVANEKTIAEYVEVNNAVVTLPTDKTLKVTNGLDVTGNAQLVVEAGSTLVVGEGGVTAENTDNIVITADENGSASFLLDPKVIVNTTPNLTVKMTAKQVGHKVEYGEDTYYWFRFAAPVAGIEAVEKVPARGTYFYKWNYAANEWGSISALSELTPFQGYSLTTEHEGLEDVTYTFKGQLAGNQNMSLDFKSRGYNYFGNSYTGYIDVHALVAQLMENENIDGSIYLWNNEYQIFYPVTLGDITSAPVEIAPMQTFILRQINTGEAVSTELNYASAIWGNPRYGKVPAGAPARYAKANNVSRMNIVVTAANGKKDYITLKEADAYSNDFEKGFDALKYMNERTVNLYTTIDGENYGIVATDNLEGMKLSFQTVNEIAYTLSFENINGAEYAIRDNATGVVIAIEEGSTYDFNAQPNSTVEGRFEIVNVAKVATGIENAEVKANVKGIYTITGQYVGEDFNALPAGVYVVNGVKIVK